MSLPAKITLGISTVISFGIVAYVHYIQQYEREKMHEGVLRDLDMQQRRKIENIYILERQKDLTKRLQSSQLE